ncbi:glycosyltransferase family 2 protein [Puniceibacterium sediminis]|uniref:Glycosyl transferase family 2 n=1 Tax=Puniceibacterium sediminis TaxID=1608407 RepID=A0A238YPQ5_9RHOB|nr:glycosyltransferase [Puniceibacterium sediminis]SNR72419.1 Glycosyl transferase family 2 [Puniceibacterium sediminis]
MTVTGGTDSETEQRGPDGYETTDLLAILSRQVPLADRLRHLLLATEGRGLSAADLAQVLAALMAAEARNHATLTAQAQKAQFEAQHYRTAATRDRLSGDTHAMGLLLAEAMHALPRWRRGAFLDAPAYLAANPDVAAAGANPLKHYLSSGAAEGRLPRDLVDYSPDSYADHARPATLEALSNVVHPRFAAEFPASLRDTALAAARSDGRNISVVMPTWNRAHVIVQAINSALLQSRPPQEMIVVDDGSTDGTVALLREQFPEPLAEGRLVLIEAPHVGVSAARNAGLGVAQGEIIAYLDSDNIWEPDHLLFACSGLIGTAGRKAPSLAYTALCRHNLIAQRSDILFHRFDRAALEAENYIDLNSLVHTRALYEHLGGFDPALTRLVDWDLLLRYSAANPAVAIPVLTVQYFLGGAGGQDSITLSEPQEPNMARIRAKLAGSRSADRGAGAP